MIRCDRLSDRMPEVAVRRAAWSTEEAAHLASCAECRGEWELVLAARRLGARAPLPDAEAIAVAIQRRLAAERAARGRARRFWSAGSAVAAAAAVAVAVTIGDEPGSRAAPAVAAEAEPLVPLPELEGLESAQLDTLLQALEGPFAATSMLESSTLGDDGDAELEQILAGGEG